MFEALLPSLFSTQQIGLACLACEAAVAALIDLFVAGVDPGTVEAALEVRRGCSGSGDLMTSSTAQGLCALLGIMDREVCHGGIANYAPIIEYIIANK